MKSLKDIAWQVDEETYRADPAYSYSTISRFHKEGFENLNTLFDKVETPALLFGSCVDTLLTDGKEAFDKKYFVASFNMPQSDFIPMVKQMLEDMKNTQANLINVSDDTIVDYLNKFGIYQNNWKKETKAQKVREACNGYYSMMVLAGDKTVVPNDMYQDALDCVETLRTSPATEWYFREDNPYDGIERLYQLKFKGVWEGINLRSMMDILIADHNNKTLQPCDLKTSGHMEYDFYKSFIQWNYFIQCSLYSYLLKELIKNDDYYKDFKILPYKFIVINRKAKSPKIWQVTDSMQWCETDYTIGNIEFKNWRNIVKELDYYLTVQPNSPIGIKDIGDNSLYEWIEKIK